MLFGLNLLIWNELALKKINPAPASLPSEVVRSARVIPFSAGKRRNNKRYISQGGNFNNTRILVIAPHPDDEILCCSTTLQKKMKQGAKVSVIYVTSGDAKSRENISNSISYGFDRERESIRATEAIKISRENLYFLNFPDQYLTDLNNDKIVKSIFTGKTSSGLSSYFPNSPYSLKVLKNNLWKLISTINPTEIYLSSPKDNHLDHARLGEILPEILQENKFHTKLNFYTIHTKKQKIKHQKKRNLSWWESNKLGLIRNFPSQFHNDKHRKFMESWGFRTETFQEKEL
jgi:LmbE family N-acetylglucosaminyl deacetylase